MSHFLDVTLSLEAMLEELECLDGPRGPRLWWSYSVSGLFRGPIERFCSNNSRAPSDFSSTIEIPMLQKILSKVVKSDQNPDPSPK